MDVATTASIDPSVIDAEPTKAFFISMLVRDIPIVSAVADLADNCIDGARRLRPDGDFTGLKIDIEVSRDRFRIVDNCGGMSVEIARSYAFRFGRRADAESIPHAIGQFGVGMKRALFRLGAFFRVASVASHSRFSMAVDVAEWALSRKWEFSFETREEDVLDEIPVAARGTEITVTRLHESVASQFSLDLFVASLISELQSAHFESMERNLVITVNGRALKFTPPMLLQSEAIKAAYETLAFSIRKDKSPVLVKIYAGLGKSEPIEAGWYVICNGRMVLEADKSRNTGWGENIPKYHNQFAEFRGYVYFDSEDAEQLPWTTTKTGVDSDSQIFQSARLSMIRLMRPVIDFLNRMDGEIRAETLTKPLTEAYEAAQPLRVSAISIPTSFRAPAPGATMPPTTGRIQYSRPLEEIRRVQQALGVTTYKEVGEQTFEYYLDMEQPE